MMTTRALKLPKSVEAGLEFGEIRDANSRPGQRRGRPRAREITGARRTSSASDFARQYDEAHKKDCSTAHRMRRGSRTTSRTRWHDIDLGDRSLDRNTSTRGTRFDRVAEIFKPLDQAFGGELRVALREVFGPSLGTGRDRE